MKKHKILSIVSITLFLITTAVNVASLVDFFLTEGMGKGILAAVLIIMFLFSAGIYLISSILSIINAVSYKKSGGDKKTFNLYVVQAVLPIIFAVIPYAIILLSV